MAGITAFYKELETSLPASTGAQRKKWATVIIGSNMDIKALSGLLKGEQKTAVRFLWMLSDIGLLDPRRLFAELPFLFRLCNTLNPLYKTSFASYWLYTGIPSENEGEAVEHLFEWLVSPVTNVTIKSRSLLVLFHLTKKYPELRGELALCLKDQMEKNTSEFKKRASRILHQLE